MRSIHNFCQIRGWPFLSVVISIVYLLTAARLPSILPYAPHDDSLFQLHALEIFQGKWLGLDYGSLTLAKGPFHSVQIVIARLLGLQPGFWFCLLYMLSAWIFCSVATISIQPWLRGLIYTGFLWDPWQFTNFGLRLLREKTYIPLLVVAIALVIASTDAIRSSLPVRTQNFRPPLVMFSLAGICFGLLLITREARIYVFILLAASAIAMFSAIANNTRNIRRTFLLAAPFCMCFLLLTSAPVWAVSQINDSRYDLPLTNEFEEGEFKAFYQDLISIRLSQQQFKPWVPLRMETINAIQTASHEGNLSKILGGLDPKWTQFGCEQHRQACDEYGGGWFMWALRDSIFEQFNVKTPRQFQDILAESRNEIKILCAANPQMFDCTQSAWGYFPFPSRWGHEKSSLFMLTRDLYRKTKGLLSPSLISYPSAFYSESRSKQQVLASRLGIHVSRQPLTRTHNTSKASIYYRLGILCRAVLIVVSVYVLYARPGSLRRILGDPGTWLIVTALVLQLALLSLVELTSFHAGSYLVIASPLFTAFLARTLANSLSSDSELNYLP